MKRYYDAVPNEDNTWKLYEHFGAQSRVVIKRLSRLDAENLVTLGNRFWCYVDALRPVCEEIPSPPDKSE